jgi:NADH-quinone oxidoreductase subunit C
LSDAGPIALQRLRDAFPGALVATHRALGDATAIVDPAQLVAVMRFLRDDEATAFEMLMDLTAVDLLGRGEPRFEVVYHLYSVARRHRLRVKVRVSETEPVVDSLTPVWPAANWMEREVWDLYGIRFAGHPDLRRLLLYEEFEGHPLRKDYPKTGRQPLIGPGS